MKLGWVLALCILFAAPLATAQDGATLVAIVTSDPNASLTRRLRAELVGLGVDVIVIKPPAEGTETREPLERAARSVGAIAAIRLIPTGDDVEVWVTDRATGKAVVRKLAVTPGGGATSDAQVAIGAVELFRASLMELHTSEPPHGDAPITPRARELALPMTPPPPPIPRLSLTVGGALAVDSVGASGGITLFAWARVVSRLGVRAHAAFPIAAASIVRAAGSVDVTTLSFGAGPWVDLVDPASRFVPSVGAGISAMHVVATGYAASGYVGQTNGAWAVAPFVGLGLGVTLVSGLRLRADVLGELALQTLRVYVVDEAVARVASPTVRIGLGLEVVWAR
jgi:hypothetical protein